MQSEDPTAAQPAAPSKAHSHHLPLLSLQTPLFAMLLQAQGFPYFAKSELGGTPRVVRHSCVPSTGASQQDQRGTDQGEGSSEVCAKRGLNWGFWEAFRSRRLRRGETLEQHGIAWRRGSKSSCRHDVSYGREVEKSRNDHCRTRHHLNPGHDGGWRCFGSLFWSLGAKDR